MPEIDGVRLKYLKREKVAEIGTLCFMPLRQSLIRDLWKNSFCGAVSEFWNCPEYDRRIFSYHFSSPTAFLRLNGFVCDMVTLMFGNEMARVEFCVRCEMFSDVESDHFD